MAQSDARPTGDQEVAGSSPVGSGNILSWRLIMKYFLRSFSPSTVVFFATGLDSSFFALSPKEIRRQLL